MVKIRLKNCSIGADASVKPSRKPKTLPKKATKSRRGGKNSPAHDLIDSTFHKITGDIQIGKALIDKLEQSSWKHPIGNNPSGSYQRCPICLDTYDSVEKQPICLPCGHTFCRICVSKIKVSIGMSQCPYDRKEFNSFMEFLPINFALIQEIDNSRQRCPDHGLYIIGFCQEHARLLCGKCLFEHKFHKCIDLESDKTAELIRKKMESLDKLEAKFENQINTWTGAYDMITQYVSQIGESLVNNPLEKIESKMVETIHKNAEDFKRKLVEFQMFVRTDLKESMNTVIGGLRNHLEIIRDLKRKFERMDTKEKLTLNLECNCDLNIIPKSVKELKKLCKMFDKPVKLEQLLANGITIPS